MPYFVRSSRSGASSIRALDVRRDDTDARDYVFQPSLALLEERLDHRDWAPVLDQGREGACVGFALATVINVCLTQRGRTRRAARARGGRVSPQMLYEMGRRYDEWAGESYEGTSLRGAMKGWHKHGVASEAAWPTRRERARAGADRQLTAARALDARRRPLGAYYRIIDSDVSHVQAAVAEGDAVLASAWVHAGWQHERLVRPHGARGGRATLRRIEQRARATGLHAFAIVGYGRDGFIIQNSWGRSWGTGGCALLTYDDWLENRQDAWVSRLGPETRDAVGKPKIFLIGFAGGDDSVRAGSTGVGVEGESAFHLISTGEKGALSRTGVVATHESELPEMARRARLAPPLADGARHVVLYAHGGLVGEIKAARNALRLWNVSQRNQLAAYFFIWETGIAESVLGWLRGDDDAAGPTRFSWRDAWEAIKHRGGMVIDAAQRQLGTTLAPTVREVFWNEMKGRAAGAAKPRGGAALFANHLVATLLESARSGDRYKLHLIAHSAGSIYLAELYANVLRPLLARSQKVTLDSIHFMAPAITIATAAKALAGPSPAVPSDRFHVHVLSRADEDSDGIVIYPSSLLTYVGQQLEDDRDPPTPILGIRNDFEKAPVRFATLRAATSSKTHGGFDDPGAELDEIFAEIARARP